jgi:hypothetical protein
MLELRKHRIKLLGFKLPFPRFAEIPWIFRCPVTAPRLRPMWVGQVHYCNLNSNKTSILASPVSKKVALEYPRTSTSGCDGEASRFLPSVGMTKRSVAGAGARLEPQQRDEPGGGQGDQERQALDAGFSVG